MVVLLCPTPPIRLQTSHSSPLTEHQSVMNSSHVVHFFHIILKASTRVFLNSLYYYYLQNNDRYRVLMEATNLKMILEFCFIFFFKWDPTIFLWLTTCRPGERCLKL